MSAKESSTNKDSLIGLTLDVHPYLEYNIKGKDNLNYYMKILRAEKTIIFYAFQQEQNNSNGLYKYELTLENFYSLNRIFRQYLSIEEIYSLFFQNYNESDIVIKKDDKLKKLEISYSIYEFNGKKNEITFSLNIIKSKFENVIMDLFGKMSKINSLQKEVEEQKKIIQELKEKLNEKEKVENILTNEIDILKKSNGYFYNFNLEEYNEFKNKIDSKIIRYDELCIINEGIKTKLNKKIKNYRLLFRASNDGFQASKFHSKCDGQNYTLTFVITTLGRRFGGFTDQAWDSSSGNKGGSNGFIFSLDNKEIYYSKNSSYNIYCGNGYGPTFGGGFDFYLCDNCNNSNSSYNNSDHSYNTYGKKNAVAGNYNFYVKDYEVYKIDLE